MSRENDVDPKSVEVIIRPTEGEWGARGRMVCTPPEEESLRRIRENDLPFTARQICICASGYYVPEPEALANARIISASKDLDAALRKLLHDVEPLLTGQADLLRLTPAILQAVQALNKASDQPVPAQKALRRIHHLPSSS